MPKVGDEEFDYTPEGMAEAQQKSEMTGMPVTNAMERNVTEYAGGGKTGYSAIGAERPMYKEGDKVPDRETGEVYLDKYDRDHSATAKHQRLSELESSIKKRAGKKRTITNKHGTHELVDRPGIHRDVIKKAEKEVGDVVSDNDPSEASRKKILKAISKKKKKLEGHGVRGTRKKKKK